MRAKTGAKEGRTDEAVETVTQEEVGRTDEDEGGTRGDKDTNPNLERGARTAAGAG